MKVFLDAGHGGKDPGAMGNGLREKDITLSIALFTGAILESHGIEVIYSRTTDTFLDLTTRATKANQAKADIFVSIHVNSATNPKATGLEVWTTKGQTKGDILATSIGNQLKKDFPDIAFRSDLSDGDIDKEENFTVISKSNMPASLIEFMFIVNPLDAQVLKTKQSEFALSTAKGILNYLGVKYKEQSNVIKLNILGSAKTISGIHKNDTNYITIEGKEVPLKAVLVALGFTNISGKGNEVIVK